LIKKQCANVRAARRLLFDQEDAIISRVLCRIVDLNFVSNVKANGCAGDICIISEKLKNNKKNGSNGKYS